MEKKRKASIFSVFTVALLVSVAVGLFMQSSGLTPSYLVFAGDSSPDEYGNKIVRVIIYQNLTGEFEAVYTLECADYITGMTIEIDANYPTNMRVTVQIKKTLCDDGMQKAIDYTRVYWTISTVCTDKLGVQMGGVQGVGDYYLVPYLSDEWTPVSDTTYSVSLDYEAYY